MRRETADPLTTGLRNARHGMLLQNASRRADAGLRKGFRIAQVRGARQRNSAEMVPNMRLIDKRDQLAGAASVNLKFLAIALGEVGVQHGDVREDEAEQHDGGNDARDPAASDKS